MRPATVSFLLVVLAAGCGDAPALASLTSAATETQHSSSTGAGDRTTGTDAEPPDSETGTSGSTDTGDTTIEGGATGELGSGSGEPAPPPTLREATLTPDVIAFEGPVVVHALADDAEGVRMRVDGGEPVELTLVAPGEFAGEIGVFTALSNGTHDVVFTAWQGEEESAPLLVQYEAKLRNAGGEAYWDASGVLGEGFGRGVAVDQVSGQIYELFDVDEGGEQRCYVRQRGAQGEYFDADLVAVLPGKSCTATAITATADGTLYVLAETELNGQKVWWLGRMVSWKAPLLTLDLGEPGEEAHALAQHPDSGDVAVCGTMPTNKKDEVDGMVVIFREGLPGYRPAPFDYKPTPDDFPNQFGETLRDCAYAGGTLVLTGELFGVHPDYKDEGETTRLVLVEYDVQADAAHWTVAGIGPGSAVQSGARSLVVTAEGTYLTLGHTCELECEPQLHLREFLPGGVPSGWNVLPAVDASATDLAWSPAGYAVLAAAKVKGPWWTEFWLQAWVPGDEVPAWSYGHPDQPDLHIVFAIAIAEYGRIYAVGVAGQGDLHVPALAIVDP
ncbi:MAG TPA: hypothetical protein VGB85_28800 [Nannocystis sp.]|jgi:hypothetical protein